MRGEGEGKGEGEGEKEGEGEGRGKGGEERGGSTHPEMTLKDVMPALSVWASSSLIDCTGWYL